MSKHCFNCKHELNEENHFCSNCGQRVDGNVLKLRVVLTEFYENYLSLDTRLGRSIVPFLFRPGVLTKEFISGRRVSYLNPFRFYLVISVLFFFTLGLIVNKQTDVVKQQLTETTEGKVEQLEELKNSIDSLSELNKELTVGQLDSLILEKGLQENLSFTTSENEEEADSSIYKDAFIKTSGPLAFNINTDKLELIKEYRYEQSYTNEALLDSLEADNLEPFERLVALQIIKLYRSDTKSVMRFMVGNLSFAMLLLIPGMALLLLLFYYKNKIPFVGHLIHSLHIHTLFLFLYSLALLAIYFYGNVSAILIPTFIVSVIYMLFSLKKVYARSKTASVFRLIFVGFLYYLLWANVLIVSILISFLLF